MIPQESPKTTPKSMMPRQGWGAWDTMSTRTTIPKVRQIEVIFTRLVA